MKAVINGQQIEVKGRKTILEVARENNIFIPSLCNHPYLEPFTGCRLCIVEVKGRKGYPPSCGTYVEEGMEIKTETPQLQKMRRQILELILSEHPNACLICSEKENCDEYKSTIRKVGEVTGCVFCSNNGRCELQDIVKALKIDKVNYPSFYRNYEVKKSDPFFDRNYNLCILCGRCVRVCHEVRGASAISFVYRGSQAAVGTVLDRSLLESGCQFCGACVDVCPTGSLTERAIKYETLGDETVKTICALCGIGCELSIELKKSRMLSSKPLEEGVANRGQACVKGRFTIKDLVYSPQRILKPLVRKKKELEEVSWEEALDFVAQRLSSYTGKEMGLVACPQLSCEDNYIIYKFAKEILKTKNIAGSAHLSPHALYQEMAKENNLPFDPNFKIRNISKAKAIFIINEDLVISHPIIWLEVLKALRNGAKLIVASPIEGSPNRFSSLFLRLNPGAEFYLLNFISKFLLEKNDTKDFSYVKGFDYFKNFLNKLDLSQAQKLSGVKEEDLRKAAEIFLEGEPSAFLFGPGLIMSPSGKQNLQALWNLLLQTRARLIPLGLESNQRGISEIEKHFFEYTTNFKSILQGIYSSGIKALYLAGPMPYLGKNKPEFLVIQDAFFSENVNLAEAVLPAATFMEAEGSLVNTEGRVQKLNKIIDPLGKAKSDWWIISQIAQRMGHKNFIYKKSADIMKEIRRLIPSFSKVSYSNLAKGKEIFLHKEKKGEEKFLPPEIPPLPGKTSRKYPYLLLFNHNADYYRSLVLSEEVRGLKIIRDSRWIEISPEDAKELNLNEGEIVVIESSNGKGKGIVKISASMPKGMLRANYLLSQNSDYSMFNLLSSFPVQYSLQPIAVKIKRGK